jgi:hypothetical protein
MKIQDMTIAQLYAVQSDLLHELNDVEAMRFCGDATHRALARIDAAIAVRLRAEAQPQIQPATHALFRTTGAWANNICTAHLALVRETPYLRTLEIRTAPQGEAPCYICAR